MYNWSPRGRRKGKNLNRYILKFCKSDKSCKDTDLRSSINSNRTNIKKITTRHIIIKFLKISTKEKIPETARDMRHNANRSAKIKIMVDLIRSQKTME